MILGCSIVFTTDTKNTIIIPVIIIIVATSCDAVIISFPLQNLVVMRDEFAPPGSALNFNDWAGTLPEFRAKLMENVRAGSVDAALPNFSTSDAITSAAFTCTLMRALQNFFTCAPPPPQFLP